MVRIFDKNMFVMLLSIMLGVIIITYFIADIKARTEEEEYYTTEIQTIEQKNINFTNYFIRSSVLLDQAREDRAFGNYNFDLAFLWYQSALGEKNSTLMNLYKERGIDNCTSSMPHYMNSHLNFIEAKNFFIETKTLTDYSTYEDVLNLYINLTSSGSRLTLLRYNASIYLKYLTENLTFSEENNNVTFLGNVSGLLGMFEETMEEYLGEAGVFEEIKEEIDEYEFFDEIR